MKPPDFLAASSKWCSVAAVMAVLCVFKAADAHAQSAVFGKVVDDAGTALAQASVVLLDGLSGQIRYGDVTSDDGSFRFVRVLAGGYRLSVSHVGYAGVKYWLQVVPAVDSRLEIALSVQTVQQSEVVVSANRAESQVTPLTFSNLSARELQEQPAMKDLPVALSTLPSITYHTENGNGIGYSTLRMRGFDQRRIAVSINGIPQNDPEDFNVFWINFFDIDGSVEDVQVQRGAGASAYGSTGIGGAINIVARPYRPYPYAEIDAGVGSFGTRRLSLETNTGLVRDRYVGFARFSRLVSDGYRDWSWTRFWRFFVGGTRYGDSSTLTVQAYGGPQRDGLAFSGIPRAANDRPLEVPDGTTIDRRFNSSGFTRDTESFHQPHVELHHELQITDRVRLDQSLFWVKGEGYFDFGATFRSADYLLLPAGIVPDDQRTLPLFVSLPDAGVIFRAYLDQWQAGWLPRVTLVSRAGRTTLGAETRLHRSLRWGRIEAAQGLPPEIVGPEADRRVYEFRGEKLIGSVRLSHAVRLHPRVELQADASVTYRRYRVYDEALFGNEVQTSYLFANPRIGIRYNPERALSAYASVSYASREPRLKSLYDGEEAGAGFLPRFERNVDGSFDMERPLVKPEHLFDAELGTTLRRRSYVVTVSGYWMEFFDEIVPSGGLDQFGVPRTGNAERTRHVGVEAEWVAQLTRPLEVAGNLALGRARFVKFSEFVGNAQSGPGVIDRSRNPIPAFSERSGHARLAYRSGGLSAVLRARFATRQFIDNSAAILADGTYDESLTIDPYLLLDGSIGYSFDSRDVLSGLSLTIDVNNMLNDEVLLYGNVGPVGPQFFPTATRHVFGTVRYTIR